MRDIKTPIFLIFVSSGAIKPDSMRRKIKHSVVIFIMITPKRTIYRSAGGSKYESLFAKQLNSNDEGIESSLSFRENLLSVVNVSKFRFTITYLYVFRSVIAESHKPNPPL